MLLYFTILLFVTAIAQYAQAVGNGTVKKSAVSNTFLVLAFSILFLFSAIRYQVAIDYISYEQIFERIRKGYSVYTEIGFNLVVKLISLFTDNNRWIFAVFSLLTILPIYKVIKKRSKDWGLSTFLFISLGYYFLSYQSIRQYLAYMIALYALDQLIDKRYGLFILWSIIGTAFHKSCCIILPVYLMAQFRWGPVWKTLFFASGFLIIKARAILRNFIFMFYPSYEGSAYDRINISYKNLLLCLCFCTVIFLCCYRKEKNRETKTLENLCLISLYFYLFCWWIPEVSRIGFFFLIPVCILFPNILAVFRNRRQRLMLKVCIYGGGILLFYVIMREAYSPTLRLLPYYTWLNFE